LITETFLEEKILPHVAKRHAISVAVRSQNALDVNLRLFDLLGRIAMFGLWIDWLRDKAVKTAESWKRKSDGLLASAFNLIIANPALCSPISDQQAIDIALLLQLSLGREQVPSLTAAWLGDIVDRIEFSFRTHGKYPCIFTLYSDLIGHPREQTDEYMQEATAGSILIPLLACWLIAFGDQSRIAKLEDLMRSELKHCTLQQWLPESESEEFIYKGGVNHGIALVDLRVSASEFEPIKEIARACRHAMAFDELSVISFGYWPILLLACRHYRLPVPPHFWITPLERSVEQSGDKGEGSSLVSA
jgi:hypothetical protein